MEGNVFLREMGRRIFLQRKSLRLTQEDLAEKIGVSTQMISNLETGKKAIRPENLSKLCKALDVSADYILSGAERNTPADPLYRKLSGFSEKEIHLLSEIMDYMDEKGKNP